MTTVREFVTQSVRLVSAHNPTIPLHGDDLKLGIRILNQLLEYYASTGLLLPIAKTESCTIIAGQTEVVCGSATFVPTPDITAGRLANLENAWLTLSGVTYPLIDESRNVYFAAWKYEPLQGLPRFAIVLPEAEVVRIRLYPAPSQTYQFSVRGKFQYPTLTSNDNIDELPKYYERYFLLAVAKDWAMFKGRADAWTDKLEAMLQDAENKITAASEVNLDIDGETDSLLNGAWRVRAGV